MSGPLSGIRVLDLTRVLAGPYATMLLADLGAEVIKVERPGEGDETRGFGPHQEGESSYFMSINRNKRGVVIDMKQPRGRELIVGLARLSDVLVQNFRPGVAERLGLDQEALLEVNPRLIYCSISAFGQTGPWAHRTAFDAVMQAISGGMSLTGDPEGPPVRMGLPIADLASGLFAAVGVLAALLERDRSGRGQFVDVGMMDAMTGLLQAFAGRYFMTGESAERVGSGHPNTVPYGAFKTSDGYVVIASVGERVWPKIAAALGHPEWGGDPRWATNAARLSARAEVEKMVGEILLTRTQADWCGILERFDVPHAPILKVGEVLEHPQVQARGMVTEVRHPKVGRLRMTGRSIRFPAHAADPMRPPPLLGEHTDEVLNEVLGCSHAQVAELRAQGVVA